MPDIRQQLREDIFSSRSETRSAQLLKNRRLHDIQAHDYENEDSYHQAYAFDEPDYYPSNNENLNDYHFDWYGSVGWDDSAQTPPSNAPSPSLSHDSDYCSSNSSFVPDQCDNFKRSTTRLNSAKSRKHSLALRKRVQKASYNQDTIRFEYHTLKQHIISRSADQDAVGFLICSSWNVMGRAVNNLDEQLSRDALNFLTQLIVNRLVRITDVLFILQQGLILTLKDTISRLGSQQADVVTLLIGIIFTEPQAASYIVELLIDTDIVSILEDFIEFGTDGEALLATRFYYFLFDIQIELMYKGNNNPVVPDTLTRTTKPTELAKTYCPALSLKRVMRPSLISSIIRRYFKPAGNVVEESFKMASVITANCLRLVHFNSTSTTKDSDWIFSVVSQFESSQFDKILSRLVQTLANGRCSNRTVDIANWLSTFCCEIIGAISNQMPLLTSGRFE
jgi:hypothetical protein